MLGKLMKYEWKASYKVLSAINLALSLLALIGCLSLKSIPLHREDTAFIAILLIVFYALSLSAFSLVTQIYIYFRFYKNLFTSEGYLMHTLPVTPMQLFHSKFLIGFFWLMLNSALNIAALAALAWSAGLFQRQGPYSALQLFCLLAFGGSPWKLLCFLFLGMAASSFTLLLMGYVSILLGQLVERYKLGASIGFYIAIYLVSQVMASLLTAIPSTLLAVSNGMGTYEDFASWFYESLMIRACLGQILFGVIFYIACLFLMQRKVNLN